MGTIREQTWIGQCAGEYLVACRHTYHAVHLSKSPGLILHQEPQTMSSRKNHMDSHNWHTESGFTVALCAAADGTTFSALVIFKERNWSKSDGFLKNS